MIVLVEGPKNVGKTFLIECSKLKSFKFPFIEYFKTMIAKDLNDTGSESKEAFHFSTAFDVTVIAMHNSGMISHTLIDRCFLSNVVLGELQGRITHEEGLKYLDYLFNTYDIPAMIYIDKVNKTDGRAIPKDDWEFLGYDQQKDKAEQYLQYLKHKYKYEPYRFTNEFKAESVEKFKDTVLGIKFSEYKRGITDVFGLREIFNESFLKNFGI